MTELSNKILDKIKEEKIEVKSKWTFLLKDSAIWTAGGLALILGGLAFSVILFMFINNEWDIYSQLGDSLIGSVLLTLPYFWIIFLGIFLLVIHYNIKHTKKGYKHEPHIIVIIAMLLSALLGTLFYNVGLGQAIDDVFTDNSSIYRNIINQRGQYLNQPDKGVLHGRIIDLKDQQNFVLEDMQRTRWDVISDFEPPVPLQKGFPVTATGKKIDDHTFKANQLRPVQPKGPLMRKLHQNQLERNPEDMRMMDRSFSNN